MGEDVPSLPPPLYPHPSTHPHPCTYLSPRPCTLHSSTHPPSPTPPPSHCMLHPSTPALYSPSLHPTLSVSAPKAAQEMGTETLVPTGAPVGKERSIQLPEPLQPGRHCRPHAPRPPPQGWVSREWGLGSENQPLEAPSVGSESLLGRVTAHGLAASPAPTCKNFVIKRFS